jgi:hypothetical protein
MAMAKSGVVISRIWSHGGWSARHDTKGAGWVRESRRQSKEAASLARDRPCFPIFRRPGSVSRSQLMSCRSYSRPAGEPAFPVPRHSFAARAFLFHPRCIQSPECRVRLVSDSLASLFFDSLRSSVLGSLASSLASPPGVPFPVLLRVPLPVLLMAFVYSLLLEDFSSVELKDTPVGGDCKSVNRPIFVEIKGILWKRTLSASGSSDRVRGWLWIT